MVRAEKTERQKVRLAAQLLSNTVAEALKRYRPGEDPELAENTAEFIKIVNLWFDIFNSYTSTANIPTKSAYGTHLQEQDESLDKMYNTTKNMRALGKNTLQTFQKGILMSIKSLKQLFLELKSTYGSLKYICTHKLNQDCLENFFFQIRSRGPDEHPTPNAAIQRMRLIILGKNPGILDSQVNTHDVVPEEYISASVLKNANIDISDALVEELQNESTQNSSRGSILELVRKDASTNRCACQDAIRNENPSS
ncbi:hypothetical protein Zmor_014164 [Zophobas morio]|uniref:Transposable element P transposase n=1 Tax=Zophobas morio TaxID=2755281 RepID=A0AA38IBP6_9CUCU|nr:hypothetical protein Zmor_014164 [Zophobas morio]